MTDGQSDQSDPTFTFGDALAGEYRAIWGQDRRFASAAEYQAHVLAGSHGKQAALCLSGGGIRSAAFALGVIQSLARQGLLSKFHYLSTVSGGGYIGAWLQAWILALVGPAEPSGQRWHRAVGQVEADLHRLEPHPVDVLRNFTSFLTPQPGLASPDTWTGIVLVIRNTAINWAVFGPALFALALLPLGYRELLFSVPSLLGIPLLVAAALAAGFSAQATCSWLPSHATKFAEPAAIRTRMVLPAVLWTFLLPLGVAPFLWVDDASRARSLDRVPVGLVFAAAILVALLIAYGLAWLQAKRAKRPGADLFRINFGAWIAASITACAVLGGGIELAFVAAPGVQVWTAAISGAALLAAFGPPWAMLSHLCLSSVFVALRRQALRGELDREWLARLSAIKVLPILIWGIFAAICLLLQPLLLGASEHLVHWATGIVTAASAIVARVMGASSKTPAVGGQTRGLSFNQIALAATTVFGVGLFVLLAGAGEALLNAGGENQAAAAPIRCAIGLGSAALLLFIAWFLGSVVNINRFSLHNVYRNRLARAFLGSGRETTDEVKSRDQDPFTRFDPADNPRVHGLRPKPGETRRLFPVIGTALNLVSGAPAAWAERKAAPFTITPVACGSESLPAKKGMHDKGGRFVDPMIFGGREKETGEDDTASGITLGTAMAISGAAVSPNMGYHSSPATAFLLTLFNVRLGVWLPNPSTASADALRQAKPPNSLLALADEMLGRTGYDRPAIYLSDGGHFDNLGLYEMVRRGCRLIVVVDAGEDHDFAYRDLADVVRKIRIDQRVEINFTMPMPMVPSKDWKQAVHRPFALATVTWPNEAQDGPRATGQLLYIKPCLFDGVPLDLQAYARQDPSFPADPTLDQFFTESRFESYRRLGLFIGETLQGEKRQDLADFLERLRAL